MNNNIVPIVFSTNDKYAAYLGVVITSLIKHASADRQYIIYILSTYLSYHHKQRLLDLKRKNIEIITVDVSEKMADKKIPTVRHLSPETTFRLLVDDLFPEYDKVLYLDCDIIINHDVAELYDIDLADNILGVARARLVSKLVEDIENNLCIPYQDYFNAGVLLININRFREANIGKKCIEMLQTDVGKYKCMDQDVLNITCQGNVKFISDQWNVEWAHIAGTIKEVVIDESRKDSLKSLDDPYIIHFTTEIKPWAHPENIMADYFWNVAKKTVFYEEILMNNSRVQPENAFSEYLFPWDEVKANSRVVIYGAGKVGRAFLEQCKITQYCEVVAVCDKNADSINDLDKPVIKAEQLAVFRFDCIVVAIEDESVANLVVNELGNIISDAEIIWMDYRRSI